MIYRTEVWLNNKITVVVGDDLELYESELTRLEGLGGTVLAKYAQENELEEVIVCPKEEASDATEAQVIELQEYLPTSKEIDEMDLGMFSSWVDSAYIDLSERAINRDPLYYLKSQISYLLNQNYLTDSEKEKTILKTIRMYQKNFNS